MKKPDPWPVGRLLAPPTSAVAEARWKSRKNRFFKG
jgi:hypothetical protein